MTTTTTTTTDTSAPGCTFLDIYLYPVDCGQIDPCLADGSQTMWTLLECRPDNPPMTVFCAQYPDHPFCLAHGVDPTATTSTTTTTATSVEVGPPPTLPPTGATTSSYSSGIVLLFAGTIAVITATVSRRRRRG